MLLTVLAAAGPTLFGVGYVFAMSPTIDDGADWMMFRFRPNVDACFDFSFRCSTRNKLTSVKIPGFMRDGPLEKEPLHVAHVCSLAFVPFRHGARV